MNQQAIFQQVLNYIEENLKAEIDAEELAAMAGYSLFHFYRLFQQATGMPVMQYILRRRLLYAIYEMQGSEKRIQVALEYGFDTYAGFYRAFQRMFQCTPTQYLSNNRAKKPCRIQLNGEEAMHITHKKAKEILKHWMLENEEIKDIYYDVTGNRSENAYYVGDKYVLKFTENLGKVMNQQRLSALLQEAGLAAAVAIPTQDGKPYVMDGSRYFHLTQRIQGKQMNAKEMYSGHQAAFLGEIIGQLHRALAKADGLVNESNLFKTVGEWALPNAREHLGLSETFCRSFMEKAAHFQSVLPTQCIHRDPNPGNVIVNGQAWGFIDFELSEQNIRLYDPCYAATAILSETFDTENADEWLRIYHDILEGYDRVNPLTEDEKEAAPYVVLGNQLICVSYFATQEKYQELFRTNCRMFHFLYERLEQMKLA